MGRLTQKNTTRGKQARKHTNTQRGERPSLLAFSFSRSMRISQWYLRSVFSIFATCPVPVKICVYTAISLLQT